MSHNYKHVVRKFFTKPALLLSLLFVLNHSYGQSPLAGIPGMVLWLRADMGIDSLGDSISTWRDQSGLGNDAVATPGNEPRLIASALNGMPTVLFNGTSDYFTGPQIAALNNNGSSCGTYIFMVTKGNAQAFNGSASAGLFVVGSQLTGLLWERNTNLGNLFVSYQTGDPANDYIYNTSAIPAHGGAFPYKLLEIRKSEGASVSMYANSAPVGMLGNPSNASMIGPFTNAPYTLGFATGTTDYYSGEIAEVIVFNGTCLSGAQIAQIETYLGTKYSPPVHIGPRDTTITTGLCALPLTAPTGFASYLWSTGATTNSISVSASGTYSVIITDQFGALQYDTTTVTFPSITLNSSAILCQGGATELVPNVPGFGNYTYNWSSGQTTDSISITTAGTYKVTVTDVNHCSVVTNTESILVDGFRNSLSLGAAASRCSGNRISLISPTTGWNRLGFNWSNGSTDSVIVLGPGSGTYTVTVTDANGCSGSALVNITITGIAPYVNFSGDTVCEGLAFAPNNLSDSVHVAYLWNFGDGTATSALRYPSHTYSAPGLYDVHLVVSDTPAGCSNDTFIQVVVNALPSAAFQSGLVCTSDPSFNFEDLSTPVSGQSLAAWKWQFGDSINPLIYDTSSIENPTHTYSSVPDTYRVVLTVTQGNGCSATARSNFIVEIPPVAPLPPVLVFPANGSVSATNTVTFGWQTAPGAVYYKLVISTDPSLTNGDSAYYNIYSNQKTVTLPGNETYYWQVTAFNPCGDIAYSLLDTVTLFNPSNLDQTNLSLWLKADAGVTLNGNNVTQWNDQSANNNNAVASGPGEPTIISQVPLLNNMPSVQFGSSAVMTSLQHTNLGSNSITMFIVARADAPIGSEPGGIFTIGQLYNGFWVERAGNFEVINSYTGGAGNAILSDATIMPNAACPYHVYGVTKNLNSSLYLDSNGVFDILKANSQIGATFTDTTYVLGHMAGTDPYGGNVPYGYMNGEIAEIIVYKTLLSTAQQQQVYDYIFNKYAPPVNLGPDIVQNYSLCPVTLHTGNRFVKYLWSTGATSDTLIVTQSGKYWVQTLDVFNHYSSDTINVTLPYRGSSPDTDFVCHGDTGEIIQLINQPSAYSYQWFYSTTLTGTYSNMNVNSDTLYPVNAGYYYAKITDNGACSLTTPATPVIIDNFYNAQLLPAFDTVCTFGTLAANPGSYVIDSFLWLPINDTVPQPNISNSGTYYLYSVDNHGCRNYDSTQLTTRAQAPEVNFTVPNTCLTNTTYFIDSSFAAPNDSITGYFWNYGGGIPSTATTVSGQTSYKIDYGYGNYTVSLKVVTDSGCFAVKTKHITILPSPEAGYADSANNSVYPYILCAGAGSSLQLSDTSSAIGGSPIVHRYWKFNDIVSADTGTNIQYTFPNQGVYNITLEVVNALGCADSITQQIDVHAPFVAEFSFNDHCLGDYTTFTDETHSFSIVSRTWKFRENGDGPYAYTPTAQIQFNAPNTYDVELQVQNAIGCISTKDSLIKIVEKPVANFTGLIACQDHYYTPLDSSVTVNDQLVKWNWDIAGHLFTGQHPGLLLMDTGAFNVSLTVTSALGCVDSITRQIEVGPVPTALFSFTPLYGTAPLPVIFTNRSTGGTYYVWNFGDGTTVSTSVPQINPDPHTYTQNGNYNVSLYAYNDYGCYDSLVRTLNIIPTDLDIAVEQVSAYPQTQLDGSELVTVVAYLSNLGTRIITSAQLFATFGSTAVLEQNWSGYLPSGQTIIDTFPAQFVAPAGFVNSYVCVTAADVNGGETEINYANNQECVTLTGRMELAGPQPNPAITSSEIGIILPQAGTVYISIMDEMGRYILPEFSMNLPVERTNYNIPVGQLQSGEYFIRVRYNDDTEVRNFVVR